MCKIGVILTILLGLTIGCKEEQKNEPKIPQKMEQNNLKIENRVFYNVFIRSFFDSNGDGIGDLNGITEKLEYLKRLGINGLWLSPLHPSDSYHKYDVKSYKEIDPEYGTLEDFKNLIEEAHKRDIVVLIDLVINHTDDNHPWFQKALTGDSYYRKFYHWQKKENVIADESHWHAQPSDGGINQSDELFYSFFGNGMPDLNYDYQPVRDEVKKIAKYWLDFGVDGFRIDAALHIYPFYVEESDRNMWKSISWWQEFSAYVKTVKPHVFLVGEVWENESVASEFAKNAINNFNFSLSEKLMNILKNEQDTEATAKWLSNYQDEIKKIRPDFVDAIFLSNHDQNRVASQLNGDLEQLKQAASIMMTLPGVPFLYYGEEIGMMGQKPDERIREPMIWYEPGTTAKGQTKWEPIEYNIPSKIKSAAAQWKDSTSLLNHYKQLIFMRQTQPAFTYGEFSWLNFEGQPKPLFAYVRKLGDRIFFNFHNLSSKPISFGWIPIDVGGVEYDYKGDIEYTTEKTTITIQGYGTLILKSKDEQKN